MTGNAFIKRLLIGLDFLSDDDKKIVVSFYEKKLSAADTLTDEETIVKSFGSPEYIALKLRETYERFQSADADNARAEEAPTEKLTANTDETSETEEVSEEANTVTEDEKQAEVTEENAPTTANEDDLIFSRPQCETPAPEVIHSLENQDVKTLYGEKVEMEVEEEEPITIDENDIVNGLTPEEIEHAKAETLEKASHYDEEILSAENVDAESANCSVEECTEEALEVDEAEESDASNEIIDTVDPFKDSVADPESTSAFYEEESASDGTEDPSDESKNEIDDEKDIKEDEAEEETRLVQKTPCLMARLFPSASKKTSVTLTVFLSILLSPLLVLSLGVPVLLHLAACAIVVLTAVLLFAVMVALVAAGVLELIYGFSLFGTAVSVALIELGMGLVLLSIVTAITALIYEYLFALVPKCIKWMTKLLKRALKGICRFLYGGTK